MRIYIHIRETIVNHQRVTYTCVFDNKQNLIFLNVHMYLHFDVIYLNVNNHLQINVLLY